MALESTGKNFGALNPQIYSTILNCGNSGLRNARKLGQLALAQFLEFAQNTDRFPRRPQLAFLQDETLSFYGLL